MPSTGTFILGGGIDDGAENRVAVGAGLQLIHGLSKVVGIDAGGVIFWDIMPLYNLFSNDTRRHRTYHTNDNDEHQTKVPDATTMTRHHLITLDHAANLSSPIQPILPRLWIQYRLTSILHDITHDFLSLIKEWHHDVGCKRLTGDEVLDARELRGLLTETREGVSVTRECLVSYLRMVEGV